MSTITRSNLLRLIAGAAGGALIASTAGAQQRQSPTEQQYNATVNNADQSKHTSQGGTQPGAGTHGHSSSPKTGETQQIQDQQHNMPATPSHSSTWK